MKKNKMGNTRFKSFVCMFALFVFMAAIAVCGMHVLYVPILFDWIIESTTYYTKIELYFHYNFCQIFGDLGWASFNQRAAAVLQL